MSTYAEQHRSLVIDGRCRTVVRQLERDGLPRILLRGATIAGWLYRDPTERTYNDLDVLVSPASRGAVIRSLGRVLFRLTAAYR